MKSLFFGASLLFAVSFSCRAELLVDFSPDTTGAAIVDTGYGNQIGTQIVASQFALGSDSVITAASIFSPSFFGSIGDNAFFYLYDDPSEEPILILPVTLDAVDWLYTTTQTGLSRKHASFEGIELAAGTYWFGMPAASGQLDYLQATGNFNGNTMWAAPDPWTTLFAYDGYGNAFVQLEGIAVPEPTSAFLFVAGGCAVLFRSRRRL